MVAIGHGAIRPSAGRTGDDLIIRRTWCSSVRSSILFEKDRGRFPRLGVAASLSTPGLGGRNWDRTVLRFGRALLRSSRRPQSIIPPSLGTFTRSDGPGRADRNPIRCSEGPSDRKVVGPSDGCPVVPGPTRSTKERLVCSRSPPAEAAHPGMCFYRPHPGAEKHGWLNTACRCNSRSSPRWPWCFEPPPRRPARRRTDPRARRVGRGR